MFKLFSPLKIRNIEFKNRIFMSPMCQYSAVDGMANDWHLVHLGSRAAGGAALVMVEATAVSPEGRITPDDLGLWNDDQAKALKRIVKFIKDQGAVAGIQIGHAGRKASTPAPWKGNNKLAIEDGGWQTIAPSAIPFSDKYPLPAEMTTIQIQDTLNNFVSAAKRAVQSGFEVIEIHNAHGYLLHQFLSPLSNQRKDEYGGTINNRIKFPFEVAKTVRENVPDNLPVFLRLSADDWAEGGWDLKSSIYFCKKLKEINIDFIDTSSGGLVPHAKIPLGPGYQIPFAEAIRKETGLLTGGVGLITTAKQAEEIISNGKADAILMARELLRNPYFPLKAAKELGVDVSWPVQYLRAK